MADDSASSKGVSRGDSSGTKGSTGSRTSNNTGYTGGGPTSGPSTSGGRTSNGGGYTGGGPTSGPSNSGGRTSNNGGYNSGTSGSRYGGASTQSPGMGGNAGRVGGNNYSSGSSGSKGGGLSTQAPGLGGNAGVVSGTRSPPGATPRGNTGQYPSRGIVGNGQYGSPAASQPGGGISRDVARSLYGDPMLADIAMPGSQRPAPPPSANYLTDGYLPAPSGLYGPRAAPPGTSYLNDLSRIGYAPEAVMSLTSNTPARTKKDQSRLQSASDVVTPDATTMVGIPYGREFGDLSIGDPATMSDRPVDYGALSVGDDARPATRQPVWGAPGIGIVQTSNLARPKMNVSVLGEMIGSDQLGQYGRLGADDGIYGPPGSADPQPIGAVANKYDSPIGPERPQRTTSSYSFPDFNVRPQWDAIKTGLLGSLGIASQSEPERVLSVENLPELTVPGYPPPSASPSQAGDWPADASPSQAEPRVPKWQKTVLTNAPRVLNALIPGAGTIASKAIGWDLNNIENMTPQEYAEYKARVDAQNAQYLRGQTFYNEYKGGEPKSAIEAATASLLGSKTGAGGTGTDTGGTQIMPGYGNRRRVGTPDVYNYGYGPGFDYFTYES